MSTKTLKSKITSKNGTAAKNSKASNGASKKSTKPKKSMYEKWIEKYGIDDSPAAKALQRAWKYTYENRHKRIDI